MNCTTPAFSHNELLSALPPAELAQLRPHLTRVRLVNGQGLHEAGERIGQVFFVEQGFVSMVAQAEGASNGVEVGLVGREGMVGLPVLLSPEAASYNHAMVQTPGCALRMSASELRDSLDALPVLRRLLFGALEVSMAQVAQTAACNGQHSLPQRLARWLLGARPRRWPSRACASQQSLRVDALGSMAAGVAHEFGNMMTIVRGSLEQARANPSSDRQAEQLARAEWGARQAERLTQQMLNFVHRQSPGAKRADLGELVRNMDSLMRQVAGIAVTLTVDAPLEPLPVLVNAGQLELALFNLVQNAADAMPGGWGARDQRASFLQGRCRPLRSA